MDVTTAVRLPAEVGFLFARNATVNSVAVAAVTTPSAPLLNTTVLLAAVVLKPLPRIVMVFAVAARLVVTVVTTGLTVPTRTEVPLLIPLVVTVALRLPEVGGDVNETVSVVAVAAATVPAAPESKTIELLVWVVSKPIPTTITVEASAAIRLAEFAKTTGDTEAIVALELLPNVLVVTVA